MTTTLEATIDAKTNASAPPRVERRVERGTAFGRYLVISELGAGAMGVVYAAYDPELDRKVAVKLVRSSPDASSTASRGQTRLLREAQALAKLAHPNVVAVYDVGTFDERVWIAMEYVEGQTLKAWAAQTPRHWREVVDVIKAALRGLASAHESGLTHRDVKPDNIMVGTDGRVRVMDFGLALAPREPGTPPAAEAENRAALSMPMMLNTAFRGTPAYMSPEQFDGDGIDAHSDQFACCVVLWELLYGERPFAGATVTELMAAVTDGRIRAPPASRGVPAWIRRACERGLSPDRNKRFASVAALLDALERGETVARRKRLAAGLAVLVTAGLGVQIYRTAAHAQVIADCDAAGASITTVWNDEAHVRVHDGLRATGASHADATAERVGEWIDRRAREWREHRTLACSLTEVEGRWDTSTLESAVWCLEEHREQLASMVELLAEADVDVAAHAVAAASGLPPLSPCVDPAVLATLPPPPAADAREKVASVRRELSRATALWYAEKYDDGLVHARLARAEAEVFGGPALIAAAKQTEAKLLVGAAAFEDGEATAISAYTDAARAGAWGVAAEAASLLTLTVGHAQLRFGEGRLWAMNAELAIAQAGDPLGLRESTRLKHLARVEYEAGNYLEAKRLRVRSLELVELVYGDDHPAIVPAMISLAMVHHALGDLDDAQALLERGLEIYDRELGPEHPDVASALAILGAVFYARGDYAGATATFARALAIRESTLGPDHPQVAQDLGNLAVAYQGLGDLEQACALQERALPILTAARGPEHPDVASAMGNLANALFQRGEYTRARALHERALAIREKVLGADHVSVGYSLGNLATVYVKAGNVEAAREAAERALVLRERSLGAQHPAVANSLQLLGTIERARGRPREALAYFDRAMVIYDAEDGTQEGELDGRFEMAQTIAESGGDMARARRQAQAARDGYTAAGPGYAEDAAQIDQWLAAHPHPAK